jgi:hypothetical protein
MNNFRNLWYITTNHDDVSNLIKLRGKQLDDQSLLDFQLGNKCQECPETVNKILLLERQWNRNSSQGFQHCPSAEMYMECVRDNIEKIDKHQITMYDILYGDNSKADTCKLLREYLERLQKVE